MFHGGSITVVLLFVRPKDVDFGHLSNAAASKIAIKLGAPVARFYDLHTWRP
jgi:hypothetical protein